MENEIKTILEVKELSITFRMYEDGFQQSDLVAVSDLSMDVKAGEIVAIAGSSGSGKSLFAHAVMGLLSDNAALSGTILYKGDVLTEDKKKILRGKEIALVPQSIAYLDPLMRVADQINHNRRDKKRIIAQKEIFKRLLLDEKTEHLFPYQLSGGMARRVLVSTALISDADLIIADEPTPGLDLEMALEALSCFRELADAGKAIILITHDIDLAFGIADRIAVFYAGTTLEIAKASDFKKGEDALRHPYTKALFRALPQNGFQPLKGFQPYPKDLPKGCLFSPRCPYKTIECEEKIPMRKEQGGYVRCRRYHAT